MVELKTPVTLGILIALFASAFILIGAGALVGSYLIAFDAANQAKAAVHSAQVVQANLQKRETQSQLRSAIPTCKALGGLAKDSNAILASPAGVAAKKVPAEASLVDFFEQYQKVYNGADCAVVLKFAKSIGAD